MGSPAVACEGSGGAGCNNVCNSGADPNASSEAASHNMPPTFHREWHRVGASSGLDVWQAGYFKCGAIKHVDKNSPGTAVHDEENAVVKANVDTTPSDDVDVNLLDSEIYSLPDLSLGMLGKQQGNCETNEML